MDLISVALGLSQFAPKIIRWMGGDKAGDIAEQVVGIAQKVTKTATPDAAMEAIKANPALAMQFEQAVMNKETELEKMFLGDRQDARARDVELRKAGYQNRRADYMVLMAFVTLIVIIALLWTAEKDIPATVVSIFSMSTGYLLKMLSDAFQFEFGSSRGSKDKDILNRSTHRD